MKKYLQRLYFFFKRRGYKESNDADEKFATIELETNIADSNAFESFSKDKFLMDVIAELKTAKKEVQEFENTLKSIIQNTTV